jgi:hypothetical protein
LRDVPEGVVVALVDRDEAVVSLGNDVLVEVAVRSASFGNFKSVEVSGIVRAGVVKLQGHVCLHDCRN